MGRIRTADYYEVEMKHRGLLQYQKPSVDELMSPENEKRGILSSRRLHLGQRGIRFIVDITGSLMTAVTGKE
jgi:hypothetical protein